MKRAPPSWSAMFHRKYCDDRECGRLVIGGAAAGARADRDPGASTWRCGVDGRTGAVRAILVERRLAAIARSSSRHRAATARDAICFTPVTSVR
jgi:hypothetical protein